MHVVSNTSERVCVLSISLALSVSLFLFVTRHRFVSLQFRGRRYERRHFSHQQPNQSAIEQQTRELTAPPCAVHDGSQVLCKLWQAEVATATNGLFWGATGRNRPCVYAGGVLPCRGDLRSFGGLFTLALARFVPHTTLHVTDRTRWMRFSGAIALQPESVCCRNDSGFGLHCTCLLPFRFLACDSRHLGKGDLTHKTPHFFPPTPL